jgi:hypothetical protein
MVLTAAGYTSKPLPLIRLHDNTGTDRIYLCLKPGKITTWPATEHRPAIRTAIPPENQCMDKPVEKGQYKPMTPQPETATKRTSIGFLPGIVPAFLRKFFEINRTEDYH